MKRLREFLVVHRRKLLVAFLVLYVAFLAWLKPDRDAAWETQVEECRKKCDPLAGSMEGELRVPNASQDRRNYSQSSKCVCR